MKITYTTANVDLDVFHRDFDAALARVHGALGKTHSLYIAGRAVDPDRPTYMPR